MMELLTPPKLCDTCGSTLDFEMPSGFCPRCLLNTVLKTGADPAAASGSHIDDYDLLNEVARGGMGIVYRARQRAPSRIVALKMILPVHLHSLGAITRFRAEAEAAASLEHEGILPIYAVGEADGAPFYSMKFAEGGTLSARIDSYRNKPRPAAALLAKLARAVACAHEHGILHRDLKPGNVLFDAADKPYVSDFGLAKWLERECDLTQTLAILGTPFYMAPEQATDSRAVTAAADIYSLGAILYHLLAGCPPVSGETPMEVLHRAAAGKPKPLSLTSRDLETICMKCLEKEPAMRYQSAAELAEDLESFCADRPIRARPLGRTSRAWRWTRRNPTLAALGTVSLGLLVVLAAIFSSGEPRARAVPSRTIAVLPFTAPVGDGGPAYFTTGLQEETLARLRHIGGLVALSSRAIAQAGDKARDAQALRQIFGVSHVVRGSVRPAGERFVAEVELDEVGKAKAVWKEQFNGSLGEMATLPTKIAEQVVLRLNGRLRPEEKATIEQTPEHDPEAYELYLHARSLTRYFATLPATVDENRPKAIELLEKAIARDPHFSLAYALLSETQADTDWAEDVTAEQIARAKATAEMAVRVGPQVPEAHLVLGSYFYPLPFQRNRGAYDYFRDKERGLEEWRTAERLAPNNAAVLAKLAAAARDRGDWKEAREKLERARQAEPLEPTWALELGQLHLAFRHYREAEEIADRTIAQLPAERATELWSLKRDIALERGDPAAAALANEKSGLIQKGSASIYQRMAQVALMQHRFAEAAELIETMDEKARQTAKLPASGLWNPYATGFCNYTLGLARRGQGDNEKARAAFAVAEKGFREWLRRYPEEPGALGMLTVCVAGQGRRDETLREITHALETFPLARDPLDAVSIRDYVAAAYAWTGDRDLGLQLLQEIVRLPNGPAAGNLKLNPRWDDLRADPRFEQIIAAAARPIAF